MIMIFRHVQTLRPVALVVIVRMGVLDLPFFLFLPVYDGHEQHGMMTYQKKFTPTSYQQNDWGSKSHSKLAIENVKQIQQSEKKKGGTNCRYYYQTINITQEQWRTTTKGTVKMILLRFRLIALVVVVRLNVIIICSSGYCFLCKWVKIHKDNDSLDH